MTKIIHNLVQGSPQWLAYRRTHFNASDAPAMMGESPYENRTQLMSRLTSGIVPDVDAATQRRFNEGHRIEALARPLAEAIIGEDLYPVVGSDGELSASFDGLTMDESTCFEHKTLNDELRACMKDEGNGYGLPLQYQIQMEQQLMVSGAERCLFMASKWIGDEPSEMRHCWYASDPKLRQRIIEGWKQFAADLVNHKPQAAPVEVIGHTPESLPALRIEVTGMVTASNLAQYKDHALAVFKGINRELTTDQHFADADKIVKWCGEVESRLAAAKQHALSQTESIDALFRTIDDISAEARRTRLELDKLVKARKDALRLEIVSEGTAAMREHIASLNARIGKPFMPTIPADFAGAIKGKSKFDSIRDAVKTTLANAKIEANAIADRIQANLETKGLHGYAFLFADLATICLKPTEDFQNTVTARITAHEAAEAAKEEATRARIQAEEQAKAEKAAREKLALEQAAEAKRLAEIAAFEKLEADETARLAKASTTMVVEVAAPEVEAPAVAEPPAKKPNTVVSITPVQPSIRTQLNARLDPLNDAELERVLSFVISRFGQLGAEPCPVPTLIGRRQVCVEYEAVSSGLADE